MAPHSSRRCASVLALLLLIPRGARATEPLGIDLAYEAPPECPTRERLEAEVRARVEPTWLDDARRFDARIERRSSGEFAGSLTITAPGDAPKVRAIEAKTCLAVTTSIAVFVAIALDPSSKEPPPNIEENAPNPPPPPPVRVSGRAPPKPKPVVPTPRGWSWGGGFDATYLHMPESAWGGRVRGELSRAPVALRLSWGFSRFSTFPDRAGEAKFVLKTARAEGCALGQLRSFSADACAGLDVGTLTGHTQGLRAAVAQTVQWVAAVAALRASWSILPWLSASAEVSLLAPFERTTFALSDPSRLVYRAPAALFGSGAGIGVTANFP